jgi:ribosomal protein S21
MACRVEIRDLPPNASWYEKEMAFKKMFAIFRKSVADAGILHDYKKHEYYESRGEKNRRKNKEAAIQRLKAKLRENFPERRKSNVKSNGKAKNEQ